MVNRIRQKKIDYKLLTIIFALLAFGLIALYSASAVVSYQINHTSTYYFFHQFFYGTIIGLLLMYITSKIDYHKWQKYTPLIIIGGIALLAAVLVPHIGIKVSGSRRWIGFGPLSFQ